jgi:glycosyltransferase involved in cell wall biosynthesis
MRLTIAADGFEPKRGSAVICVPAPARGDGSELLSEALLTTVRSVIAHTGRSTAILITGSDARVREMAKELDGDPLGGRALTAARETGDGGTHSVNLALAASHPADVVIVACGVRVTAGWLERLRGAATSDSTVASATPFSVGARAFEIFDDQRGELVDSPPGGGDHRSPPPQRARGAVSAIDAQARMVAESGTHLFPRIATVGPACAYIRRSALELVGALDETRPLESALSEMALGAIAVGMVHVAADDVLVEDCSDVASGAPEGSSPPAHAIENQVQETLIGDERTRLRRAVGVARVALHGLSVTIDARALTDTIGGTQTYMIELILALAREGSAAVRVLVAADLSARAAEAFATLPDVQLLTYEQAIAGVERTDVVHRPQPIFTPDDLTLLKLLGEKVVVGQLDLIAYHNYSYHRDVAQWRAYRRTTRLALGVADQVIFFSEHARRDALAEDLLPAQRTHLVGVGAETLEPTGSPAAAPAGLSSDEPFLLCLGADYAHKNRPFAIELLRALRELGWSGKLVLAGAHVPFGSSLERERELLREAPELAQHVLDLGPVDEPSKQWLLGHTRALVYPTLYEGFGLLPLEAARVGVPCLFAAQASLAELAGELATLVAWDARASAAAVLALLQDGQPRERHLAQLRGLSVPSWGEVAHALVAVYEHAVASPPSEAAVRAWQELDRESYIVTLARQREDLTATAQEYQDAYHALSARTATGLPLIDRGGLLSEAQQRGLMRVAARRGVGGALLAPLGWLGSWGAVEASPDSADVPRPDSPRR